VLLRQLNSEMGMTSSSSPPSHQILWKQPSLSNKKKTNNSTGAHSSSSFSPNTINHSFISIGTARNTCRHYGGYPYTNAIPSPGDTFIRFVRSKVLGLAIGTDVKSSYRLGRTGLLTEVVLLSVMLDGTSNPKGSGGVAGDSSTTKKDDTQRITGTRSVPIVATYSPIRSIDARLGEGVVIK